MFSANRFSLLTGIFLIAAAMLSFQIVRLSKTYQTGREAYAAELHFEKRLLHFEEWLEQDESERKAEAIREQAAALQQLKKQPAYWSLGFAALALTYLGLVFRTQTRASKRSTAAIIITALVCLVSGLLAPMLEIGAYLKDLSIPIKIKTGFLSIDLDYTQRFPGEMYFYYQSKSVVELIGLLFRQHNFVVGLSILLFSILIPLGKNGLSLAALHHHRLPASPALRWFLLRSGKWSMADVFVVAIFLGFLAFNNMQTGVQTQSNILTGLYFFLAYVLLAIWASVRVERHLAVLDKTME